MQSADIEFQVRDFLVSKFLLGRKNQLRDDESLLGNLIDSSGVIELVTFLQERFGIDVKDEDVTPENLDSIRNIVSFISRKIEQQV
jgi:acyl carrier protein